MSFYCSVFIGFVMLLAVWRVFELLISRRNWHYHRDRAQMIREPNFVWMVALHAGWFVSMGVEFWLVQPQFGGPVSFAALAGTLVGFALRAWALGCLGRSWNVRVVQSENYPIVDKGPYAWIRHPNYVTVVLEIAFIPLIFKLYVTAFLFSVLNALVLSRRIVLEEAYLQQNPEWVQKMAKKPRFIPGSAPPAPRH